MGAHWTVTKSARRTPVDFIARQYNYFAYCSQSPFDRGRGKGECWRDIKQGESRERERERPKKQACATLDGQQWAANSARLFAKQSAPRRKQRETIGHCFESGEAIAKKRGKDVDVEGKYLGGGGAFQRKRKRKRGGGLFITARNIVNWLTSRRVDETFEERDAFKMRSVWRTMNWWWLVERYMKVIGLVWLWNDCQTERNIVQELFEIVRLWCLILYEYSWSNVLISYVLDVILV